MKIRLKRIATESAKLVLLVFVSFMISNIIFHHVNSKTTAISSLDNIQEQNERVQSLDTACRLASNLLPYPFNLDYDFDVEVGWPYKYSYTEYSNHCIKFNDNYSGQIAFGNKEYFINFGVIFIPITIALALFYKIVVVPSRRKQSFNKSKNPFLTVFTLSALVYFCLVLCFFALSYYSRSSFLVDIRAQLSAIFISFAISIIYIWGFSILHFIIKKIRDFYHIRYIKLTLLIALTSVFVTLISNTIIPRNKDAQGYIIEMLFWAPLIVVLVLLFEWLKKNNGSK